MPSDLASADQSTAERSSPGGTCTEMTWKSCAVPRWVTGRPAAVGTPIALLTPGTTVTGTPARRQASISSPPRPKTNGSPPLSLTTNFPLVACEISASLISSCDICRP